MLSNVVFFKVKLYFSLEVRNNFKAYLLKAYILISGLEFKNLINSLLNSSKLEIFESKSAKLSYNLKFFYRIFIMIIN